MENNLKLVCPKCGTPHQPHSPHTMDADGFERCEIRTVMEDRGWCYECSFWQNMYDKHKDDPGWVRIDGESRVLKPMVENVPSGWNSLGCGGRKMYINIVPPTIKRHSFISLAYNDIKKKLSGATYISILTIFK